MPVKPAPTFGPADLDVPDKQATIIERSFRLLTPMFGGGVEVNGPEKPHDPVTAIRVASIRGQLRFWWRACNPGHATNVAELRQQEAEIWGSTSNPSAVTITVTKQPNDHKSFEVYGPDKKGRSAPLDDAGAIAYGAFPLKPGEKDRGRSPGTLSRFGDPKFTLVIRLAISDPGERGVTLEDARAGLEEALTAWSLFGGLGGRTRRGFGAIERCDDTSTIDTARMFLKLLAGRRPLGGVPSLSGATLVQSGRPAAALDAWRHGLSVLQSFRQGRGIGRGDGSGPRPGRSYWPEAEEIRLQTGSRAPKHQPLPGTLRRFPRAAFGLPIIFHFHPGADSDPGSRGDPSDVTLEPIELRRFASPLIIRVLRKEQHFLAIALRLTGTAVPDRLRLSPAPRHPADVRSHLTRDEVKTIHPLSSGNSGDVIEAFLNHFTQAPRPHMERRSK